jgi:hypothetical protein
MRKYQATFNVVPSAQPLNGIFGKLKIANRRSPTADRQVTSVAVDEQFD